MGTSRAKAMQGGSGSKGVNRDRGWYVDPYFRNHERYWDNGWTDEIRHVAESPPESLGGATNPSTTETTVIAPGGPTASPTHADDAERTASGFRVRRGTVGVPAGMGSVHDRVPAPREDDTLVVPA